MEISAARSLPSLRTRTEVGIGDVDGRASLLKFGDDGTEMIGIAIGNGEIARGDRAGDKESSGFDAVWIDAVMRSFEAGDALHVDGRGSCAFNFGAHGDEQGGKVANLGLARAVFHQRFAFGEDRSHEQIFSAGDSDLVEDDVSAFELVGAGFEIAVFLDESRRPFFRGP